ncbi:RNA polymerase sigma factor [Tengunoibacter tsumagoiensis]|uniref:RNA polymerase sigma factor n=1 Tax=Tengunoibacter tsumagoiensis TaxID=2014871 RepID=A0A402A4U9_9CHLR|nr:RNA polymerase sigma factor [Tengunoibacter tsumagoiensis]GCE14086.1 hypothetical protein KTT_39450 [Tengunoibacter tsumagoiensis]
MFNFLIFPGILLAQSRGVSIVSTPIEEKALASMTVKKAASSQDRGADENALIKLYEQFRRPIHSYTYRLLGSQEDADDITQEVFVRACTAWNGLYERDNLSSWLYRIATNLCVDHLRRRKRIMWWPLGGKHRSLERGEEPAPLDLTDFLADMGGIPEIAEREIIRMAFAGMTEEYAVALILSAAQGLTYQEIAHIVNISPNAAATRISRAKKMFAEQYQRLIKDGVVQREKR